MPDGDLKETVVHVFRCTKKLFLRRGVNLRNLIRSKVMTICTNPQGKWVVTQLLLTYRETKFPFVLPYKLNERQKQAVHFPFESPLYISAGPGSGKAHVLLLSVLTVVDLNLSL
jgi:hypothetical protein